eukprot:scaffold404748_cov43-Prasinocladus_malaysianus.AAC.1
MGGKNIRKSPREVSRNRLWARQMFISSTEVASTMSLSSAEDELLVRASEGEQVLSSTPSTTVRRAAACSRQRMVEVNRGGV